MRLLINISNNIGGGSFQVAHSFVHECKSHPEHIYIVAVNEKVYHLFDTKSFSQNFTFIRICNKHFYTLANKMKKVEKEYAPDVVFTVFGPSYWHSVAPQVVGFANHYYILINENIAGVLKKCFSKKQYLAIRIKKILHTFYMNRDADVIVAETPYATEGFLKVFKKVKKGCTVSNTCSAFFDDMPKKRPHEHFVLLTVCKYYRHKNLEVINPVSEELLRRNVSDVRFVMTLDDDNFSRLFKDNPLVINAGYTEPKDCPALYANADAMFLPTLAECFSASYLEAMKSGIPILTSDFDFARSICKNAAVYFNPFCPEEICDRIIELKDDAALRERLIHKGEIRVKDFPSSKERCESYLNICKEALSCSPQA